MRFSRATGAFNLDRAAIGLLLAGAAVLGARGWLAEHPEHDPWAPLDLNDPPGWATPRKLAALRHDPSECRAVLDRSGIAYQPLAATGEGECRREDRLILPRAPLTPDGAQLTCPVGAAFTLWLQQRVQPQAEELLGSAVAEVRHLGTYSCRRVSAAATGNWSEHATGNAIDIAAFVLEDGRRITLAGDWNGSGPEAQFLRAVRDSACGLFGTVLSPDYNAAHADHLHLDQGARGYGGLCR